MSTWVVYVVLFIISLVAAQLLLGMGKFTSKMKKSVSSGGKTSSSKWSLFKLLFLLILVSTLIFFFLFFYYYAPLRGEQVAARLNFEKNTGNGGKYQVLYTPIDGGQPGPAKKFTMMGNHFKVEAEILHWRSLFDKLGWPPMFRLTKIYAYTVENSEERRAGDKPLAAESTNTVWQIVQKVNGILQLATVKSIKSEPIVPATEDGIELYVTTTGIKTGKSSQDGHLASPQSEERTVPKKVRYPRKPEDVRH